MELPLYRGNIAAFTGRRLGLSGNRVSFQSAIGKSLKLVLPQKWDFFAPHRYSGRRDFERFGKLNLFPVEMLNGVFGFHRVVLY